MLSDFDWHRRFQQQARWTHSLRQYLYHKADLQSASSILEVGCGTGAILGELTDQFTAQIYGLDIHPDYLRLAVENSNSARLACGDAHSLPYQTGFFDCVLCHFLLLWVREPVRVMQEMARITREDGKILVLAEPDYGGRIDYPFELTQVGDLQTKALRGQGADPLIGRQIAWLLEEAGLGKIESGILGGQWQTSANRTEEFQGEWKIIRTDLAGLATDAELNRWQKIDEKSWKKGERVLYVPTFYAWGVKKS
jgi:SAM-dependent methyltransferase